MKKLITNLFLGLAIMASFQANAQYCGSQEVTYPACGNQLNFGFGDYNTFTCITRGQTDSLIIPFKIYTNFTAQGNTVTIYKLRINTIDSLPCGLCWSTSQSLVPGNGVNEFSPGDNGCIRIYGMTNDPAGSYLLSMTLAVRDNAATTTGYDIDTISAAAGGVFLWVKVVDAGAQCPDTVDQTLLQHPSTSCPAGINEVSKTLTNLSIQPNPLTNEAKISFTSEVAGTQQISITDAVGREVYKTTMTAKEGLNTTTIKRNNLSAGIYILYIGSNQGTATKKFIIED